MPSEITLKKGPHYDIDDVSAAPPAVRVARVRKTDTQACIALIATLAGDASPTWNKP
jgi:hypothetical protein